MSSTEEKLAPEEVIANLHERVTMLRAEGHPIQAQSMARAIEELVATLPEYLTWLTEGEAVLYTGRSVQYLRARFGAWAARGMARWDPARPRIRQFRRCVLEHRGNADAARELGRRVARGESA